MLTTECSKCGAEMPALARASTGWMAHVKMTITGYVCTECGHYNDLKRRKWFKEMKNEFPKEK